jgi:hypothetical protein
MTKLSAAMGLRWPGRVSAAAARWLCDHYPTCTWECACNLFRVMENAGAFGENGRGYSSAARPQVPGAAALAGVDAGGQSHAELV